MNINTVASAKETIQRQAVERDGATVYTMPIPVSCAFTFRDSHIVIVDSRLPRAERTAQTVELIRRRKEDYANA